jgi:hypothetical protein
MRRLINAGFFWQNQMQQQKPGKKDQENTG